MEVSLFHTLSEPRMKRVSIILLLTTVVAITETYAQVVEKTDEFTGNKTKETKRKALFGMTGFKVMQRTQVMNLSDSVPKRINLLALNYRDCGVCLFSKGDKIILLMEDGSKTELSSITDGFSSEKWIIYFIGTETRGLEQSKISKVRIFHSTNTYSDHKVPERNSLNIAEAVAEITQ
jgi:hypothetical protein